VVQFFCSTWACRSCDRGGCASSGRAGVDPANSARDGSSGIPSVVYVEAQQLEGQALLQVFDLGQDVGRPFVPDRPVLGPLAENVREGEAPDELPAMEVPQWRRCQPPGIPAGQCPIVGPNRDLLFEVPAAASATQAFGRVAHSVFLSNRSIVAGLIRSSLARTDSLSSRVSVHKKAARGAGLLSGAWTHLLGFEPKKLHWLQHLCVVAPARTRSLASLPRLSVQQPDRILAAVTQTSQNSSRILLLKRRPLAGSGPRSPIGILVSIFGP